MATVEEARAQVLEYLRNCQDEAERGSTEHAEFLREAHELTAPRMPEDLDPRETRFVREFVVCREATESYKRTGTKATHESCKQLGYEMLHRPNVQAAIAVFDHRLDVEAQVTRTEILRALKSNARKSAAAGQYAASTTAWTQLGKELHGMFGDRLDVRVLAELQDLLEMVTPHMKPESYAELIRAIAKAQGDEAVAGSADAEGPAGDEVH